MIKNQTELNDYSIGKVYIPSAYVNSNYTYRKSSGYIQIITDSGCTGTGSSRYCNCRLYYSDDNVVSSQYSCQSYIANNTSNVIPFSSITSDINYSNSIKQNYFHDKFVMFGIIIIALLFFISLKKGYRYK